MDPKPIWYADLIAYQTDDYGIIKKAECPECGQGLILLAWDQDVLLNQRKLLFRRIQNCCLCGQQFEIQDQAIGGYEVAGDPPSESKTGEFWDRILDEG